MSDAAQQQQGHTGLTDSEELTDGDLGVCGIVLIVSILLSVAGGVSLLVWCCCCQTTRDKSSDFELYVDKGELKGLIVAEYGTLGTFPGEKNGTEGFFPDQNIAFVDAASWYFLDNNNMDEADDEHAATSKLVYLYMKRMGAKGHPQFPFEVRAALLKVGDAVFYDYGGTDKELPLRVVHTVGPNYEHPRPGREDVAQNACQDTDLLAAAYTNSILKFGQVAVAKNITTLRLPVISAADKNIGQCKDLLQDMTRAALKTTFQNAGVRKILADPRMRIILCLFGSRADLKISTSWRDKFEEGAVEGEEAALATGEAAAVSAQQAQGLGSAGGGTTAGGLAASRPPTPPTFAPSRGAAASQPQASQEVPTPSPGAGGAV